MRDVKPILDTSCVQCHAGDKRKGEFSINSRDSLLLGGKNGKTVEPGHSDASRFIHLVAAIDPEEVMPPKGDRLTPDQVSILRAWIDQDLPWPDGFSYKEAKEAKLAPRKPELPADAKFENPIDRLMQPYFSQHQVKPADFVADKVYARRVYLDLIGLLPTPQQLDAFVKDTSPNKRAQLVESLLDDRRAYADHWLTFWNDALRNAYAGTGFIDNGRGQLTGWLYKSLYDNKPYDQFVRELISPVPGSEAFTKGIIWRGVVNASQRPEMQAAQSLSQVFFGLNLKCASCHDSPINELRLTDSYALAGVFADEPLDIHRCDKPIGKKSEAGFIFPQLGQIDAAAPKAQRLVQLADLVTSAQNGRLSRTIVNRYWAILFGRGLVEPVDEMDNAPWNEDVLDYLAADLQEHNYDLKHTLHLICTSRAYQMPSVGAEERQKSSEYVFRGPLVRRLSAEQYIDGISMLTNQWQTIQPIMLQRDGRGQGGQLGEVRQVLSLGGTVTGNLALAKWIWNAQGALLSDPGGRLFIRKTFTLDTLPQRTVARASADNEFTLYVNGTKVAAEHAQWNQPKQIDLTPHLRVGANTLAVEAINYPDPSTGKGLEINGASPAGFILYAAGLNDGKVVWELGSDETWQFTAEVQPNWMAADFQAKDWKGAVVVAPFNGGVWGLANQLLPDLNDSDNRIRASLAMVDALQSSLGRPSRDQVVTHRDSAATTLQALELTNGKTLDEMLRNGASYWMTRGANVPEIYLTALGRLPTEAESAAARELVGDPATAEGVTDLLWNLAMLPDFQLIY